MDGIDIHEYRLAAVAALTASTVPGSPVHNLRAEPYISAHYPPPTNTGYTSAAPDRRPQVEPLSKQHVGLAPPLSRTAADSSGGAGRQADGQSMAMGVFFSGALRL